MRRNSFDEKGIHWASATNTCFTSNWWHRPMKFWHKKLKTLYYIGKLSQSHWEETSGSKSLILFPNRDW